MANHPLNLTLRFVLELIGLFALSYWGWTQHTGAARYLWAVGGPLLAAALWGTFRVPGDHGHTPVIVPGPVRLGLEALYFSAAVWAFFAADRQTWGWSLAVAVLLHYLVSYDRVLSLLKS